MNFSSLAHEGLPLPAVIAVRFTADTLVVDLSDGRTVTLPLAWYPALLQATQEQLLQYTISPGGYGIQWPLLDEDLSAQGFLFP